ncbi:tRNA (guanine(26)-N(2))-dimethyltransferase-like protein [Leptotrombidium deliense]|uniref:tRNA (guanine(26)-N(2))-dimethyltransferase n=1 Tax=Leptotrombidium deliense TaxID=299467 RepID=A0A443SKK2_9ACAR|nr:tRNA (guanine(26)-N(2))-dimethyltransferase-like protein [Leptotrombidium deliense]
MAPTDPPVQDSNDPKFNVVHEGKAEILQPNTVFYNPVQTFNRDLSVLVVDTFFANEYWTKKQKPRVAKKQQRLRIIDALSATGLRSIRYAKELECIGKVDEIIANDLSHKAVEIIQKNVERNQVSNKVKISNEDASNEFLSLLLYMSRRNDDRFVVIDIDPFGCASPFIDAAVQSILDGGILMVTCTDMAILCGNHSETCYAKYGSMSFKSVYCHELALRIVLKCIETSANRYGRYIVPLLSISVDFYIRLFMQVSTSPAEAKLSASKTANIYQCNGCNAFTLQKVGRILLKNEQSSNVESRYKYSPSSGPVVNKECSHCGHQHTFGGPIWSENLHDFDFVDLLKSRLKQSETLGVKYETQKRLEGMLQVVSEEIDVPLYYTVDNLCRIMHCRAPNSEEIRSAILNAGFRVSYSHANRNSLKTDAPAEIIWDIMRHWIRQNSVDLTSFPEKDAGKIISMKNPTTSISFTLHEFAKPLSKELELSRFQPNPIANWGPGALPRADAVDKRNKNQGKRHKNMKSDSELDETKKRKEDDSFVKIQL